MAVKINIFTNVICLLVLLEFLSFTFGLLCYNGTLSNIQFGEDPLSRKNFISDRKFEARIRCALTVRCAGIYFSYLTHFFVIIFVRVLFLPSVLMILHVPLQIDRKIYFSSKIQLNIYANLYSYLDYINQDGSPYLHF